MVRRGFLGVVAEHGVEDGRFIDKQGLLDGECVAVDVERHHGRIFGRAGPGRGGEGRINNKLEGHCNKKSEK
uniref:Uncharacterized protein n=1 Tax=Panagrellus redivivus TaxID=6233 RepID=A0A7E4VEK6_PANRE